MKKHQLKPTESNTYYHRYLNLVDNDTDLVEGLIVDKTETINYFKAIPEGKLEYRYQPEKWTIKDILQHLIDTERVFVYRCFVIAREDKTHLPGFEQDDYVAPAKANKKLLNELLEEFEATRNYTISIIKSLSPDNLEQLGNASGHDLSSRASAFIVLGHRLWHTNIINKRYL